MSKPLEVFVTKGSEGQNRDVNTVTGAMRDTQVGKYRYDLIGLHMLKRLALLLERGANKYGARNWEKGQNVERTSASLLRHVYAYLEGDREEDHLAAVVFNAMSIMHVEGEVLAGKLPFDLLDLPFYKEVYAFATAAATPTWAEEVVLRYMEDQQDVDPADCVEWTNFDIIKAATFPSVKEQDFALLLYGLTIKGYLTPEVVEDAVHPDYALQSAVLSYEELDHDETYYDD